MFSSLLVLSLAALAPLANANVFVTAPTASTSIPAGQNFTIKWQDDGNSPTSQSFGAATVGLWVGSVNQQFLLQAIGDVDVSKETSIAWTPDASVGPDSNAYFIRFTSVNLKDANNSQYNAEAFSSKFSLTGMKGTFNSTIQGVISGSGSVAAPTAPPTASGSGSGLTSKSASAASTAKASAAASSASGSGSSKNSAGAVVVPRVLGATGVAAIVFAFFL